MCFPLRLTLFADVDSIKFKWDSLKQPGRRVCGWLNDLQRPTIGPKN